MDGTKAPSKKPRNIPIVPRKLVVRKEDDLNLSQQSSQVTALTSKSAHTRNLIEAQKLNAAQVGSKRHANLLDLPSRKLNK